MKRIFLYSLCFVYKLSLAQHIRFRLNPKMVTCERIVQERDIRPHCDYPPELTSQAPHSSLFHRYRQSACDLATCTLKLEVFVRKYDPTRCACRWTLAEARRCTCCGKQFLSSTEGNFQIVSIQPNSHNTDTRKK